MTAADAAPVAAGQPVAVDSDRRRVLVAGDAEGNLPKLYAQVENQQRKVGTFDVLFSVGAFLPSSGGDRGTVAAEALAEYVAGRRQAPLETYFVESRSAALLQASPEGKQLCKRIHFLGGYGIREIMGLQVAYLSGRYDPSVYSAQESSESGPAFVGAAYTPHAIAGLLRLACASGGPIDMLLTAEWPARLGEKLDASEGPKDPEDVERHLEEAGAPPISELCAALEPRYHLFGTADVFYQRPPFQTHKRGHVCRCIALGKVGSKGKGRLWIHGLALSPAKAMPEAALMQRPENTTPCPFATSSVARTLKRSADETEEMEQTPNDGAHVIPDQIFLSRLPPNIEENRLRLALRHIGKIERIHLARDESVAGKPCKGYGWVTFSTPEEAESACDLSGMLECGGRQIEICLSKPRPESCGGKRRRAIEIIIEPHADCWFCLVNPKVEKHMIVSATTEVYIATARGPILPTHVMVLPVKHAPCYAACPLELQAAIQVHIAAIRKMCANAGQECFVWERWIPMSVSAANHMQIQILPIDVSRAGAAREALEETTKRYLPGASLKRLASHAQVAEYVNDDSATPYVYFEVPGDNSAKGRLVERYLYAGTIGGPRIPINFCRQAACTLLGCDEKVDWRQCQEDRDTERELASSFRELFKPFQPRGR